MQHSHSKALSKCSICGASEGQPGSFPMVVGVGRVCLEDGMKQVTCDACGKQVKRLTSSRLQGRTLCLADHMKEIEKFRKNVMVSFDEDLEPMEKILVRAGSDLPEGYTLLAVRRARNSTHVWEAEYEKTELFQMRCS